MVGDSTVGKTCMVHSFGESEFLSDYVPTVATNYESSIEIDETEVQISIVDTCGQDEFREIRILNYNDIECFVMCFALDDPSSLENCVSKWKKEV